MAASRRLFRVAWGLSVVLTFCGCNRPAGQPSQVGVGRTEGAEAGSGAPLVKVTPIRPARKTLVRRTEQPGQIEAFEETPLSAKVAGHVAKIHVDIGDTVTGPKFDSTGKMVQPGQVLVELSVPELDGELAQKRALIGQAEAEVQQAAAGIRVAEAARVSANSRLEETQASVARAQADYDRYKSEFERMSALADKGSVTRQVADEKENLLRAADAARKEVAARIASARAAVTESQALLEKARADHEASQAHVAVARAEEQRVAALAGYMKIRAPFDGVVAVRNVHTGHLVQPATGSGSKPLLVVIRTDIVRIFVEVPESDAVFVKPEAEAQIRIPSLSTESFTGKVTRSTWKLDAGTRTLRAEIDVDNPDGRLRPGMYAYADLKVAERKNALALPASALWTADGQVYCFVIDDSGSVRRRSLKTGIRAAGDVEIVSGLSEDDQVIGVNPSAFREGQRIEVVAPAGK